MPYAGRVRALGRLPSDLESEITRMLSGKTVDPQVIVTVAKREGGDLVSVGETLSLLRKFRSALPGLDWSTRLPRPAVARHVLTKLWSR